MPLMLKLWITYAMVAVIAGATADIVFKKPYGIIIAGSALLPVPFILMYLVWR